MPEPSPPSDARLRRLEGLAHLLDDAIRLPVIGYRVGWEAVVGLVPGLGDVAGLLLSLYLVFEASRFGLPKATLARMVFNVAVEAVVGVVPLLGDLFDAAFKANLRNLALLHAHLGEDRTRQHTADRRFLAAVLVLLLGIVLVLCGALYLLLSAVLALLPGG